MNSVDVKADDYLQRARRGSNQLEIRVKDIPPRGQSELGRHVMPGIQVSGLDIEAQEVSTVPTTTRDRKSFSRAAGSIQENDAQRLATLNLKFEPFM